jgi:glycosyltransferase involved in cell wall biosynthesis
MQNWRGGRLSAIRLGMLSVLIETLNDEEGLARTLASLIGGAVEGVVRDVVVCDTGSTDQTHRVADHAGCQYVSGGIAAGIGQAKGEWLLLLEPGARLAEGWVDEVAAHTARQSAPARFSRARGSRAPFLSRVFSGNRALAEGLVISKRQAAALSKNAHSAEAIARGLATKRLDAEIWVAPEK